MISIHVKKGIGNVIVAIFIGQLLELLLDVPDLVLEIHAFRRLVCLLSFRNRIRTNRGCAVEKHLESLKLLHRGKILSRLSIGLAYLGLKHSLLYTQTYRLNILSDCNQLSYGFDRVGGRFLRAWLFGFFVFTLSAYRWMCSFVELLVNVENTETLFKTLQYLVLLSKEIKFLLRDVSEVSTLCLLDNGSNFDIVAVCLPQTSFNFLDLFELFLFHAHLVVNFADKVHAWDA